MAKEAASLVVKRTVPQPWTQHAQHSTHSTQQDLEQMLSQEGYGSVQRMRLDMFRLQSI
jgi:hypothetical protein